MMFIDLHSHLDLPQLYDRIDTVIEAARQAQVKVIVTSGVHPQSNRTALQLAERFPLVKASLGLYPVDALQRELNDTYLVDVDDEISFIREHRDSIVAIGEVGLDYKTGQDREVQRTLFMRMLDLAVELEKPVIVHSRSAEAEALEVLKAYPQLKVILHCFSAKKSLVLMARERNYSFTIPTHVVRAYQFQEIIKLVPLSQLFSETDSPMLSPFKDKPNEPFFVIESYKKIAEIKGMDIAEVANIIYSNWQRVFL